MRKILAGFIFGALLMLSMATAVPAAAVEPTDTQVLNHLPTSASRTLTLQEKIIQAAVKAGLDPEIMLCIAQHESGLNPTAKNAHSTATGLFQFLAGTWTSTMAHMDKNWPPEDRNDPDKSIQAAMDLARQYGYTQWEVFTKRLCP
jgi:soluble lytic murein transglycosylase-like protein